MEWHTSLTDPEALEAERRAFRAGWTALGTASDLVREGQWVTADLWGVPVFVQRFKDGVRGFVNICPHRGYPLRVGASGEGPVQCGFHHWTYDAEGCLSGAPKCLELFGVRPSELGVELETIDVAICGGIVFGRMPTATGPSLQTWLGPVHPILERFTKGSPAAAPRGDTFAANWKLGCHIALDDYHIVAVHPDTLGRNGYLDDARVRYDRFGPHSAFFLGAPDGDDLERAANRVATGTYRPQGFRVLHIFPNLLVTQVMVLRTWMTLIQQYVPVEVARTELRSWVLRYDGPVEPAGMVDEGIRRVSRPFVGRIVRHYTGRVGAEDHDVCERIQANAGRVRAPAPLSRHETRVGWFQEAWARALRIDEAPTTD